MADNALRRFSLVLILAGIAVGCAEPVAAPKSYAKWTPNDSVFHIEYPEGWNAEGNAKDGRQWAEFSKGNCMITCQTDVSSSLIGDIAESAMSIGGVGGEVEAIDPKLAEELAPVAQVHDLKMKEPPPEFKNYKEEDAQTFRSQLGDGRKSEFKASVGLGRKVKGYRVTALTNDRGITIFCYCPEKDWKKMQPAFDHVLESLSLGS